MNSKTFTKELLGKFYTYVKLCDSTKDSDMKRKSGRLLQLRADMFSDYKGEDIRCMMTGEICEKCALSEFLYINSLSTETHLVFMDLKPEEIEENGVVTLSYPSWDVEKQKPSFLKIRMKMK